MSASPPPPTPPHPPLKARNVEALVARNVEARTLKSLKTCIWHGGGESLSANNIPQLLLVSGLVEPRGCPSRRNLEVLTHMWQSIREYGTSHRWLCDVRSGSLSPLHPSWYPRNPASLQAPSWPDSGSFNPVQAVSRE